MELPTVDHGGHRERLRAQFLTSPESMHDGQLLELLLFYALPRQDTAALARQLIAHFGSLRGVLEAPVESLCAIKGVGRSAAVLLAAIMQVTRRLMDTKDKFSGVFTSRAQIAEYLMARFFGERDEVVYVLCLDAKWKLLACRLVHRGNVNMSFVSTRRVLEAALACNASVVVLAHNHPSGIALPSPEDEQTTGEIDRALRAVGIELFDHLVVVDGDYVSFRDNGFFDSAQPI